MRQLLDHAAENGYGLPAFNVNNLEQVRPSWKPPMKSARP
jgi:fructose-bisphosphate aldolase class II